MVSTDGTAKRRINASTCEEAVEALSLIAALLAQPGAIRSGSAQQAASVAQSARPGLGTTAATSARERVDAPPAPPARANGAKAPLPASPQEPEPARAPSQALASARRARLFVPRVELTVLSLLASGIAPALRAGIAFDAALGFSSSMLDLSLHVGARGAFPHTARSDAGAAHFAWLSGLVDACIGARTRRHFTTAGCLASELGRIVARGSDTAEPQRVRPLWFGLGPALRIAHAPHRRLVLVASASALFSGARDKFLIGERELHRVPLLTFRCELGVGVRFE